MKTHALLVIDIQRWFFRTSERSAKLPALLEKTNKLIASFRQHQKPIIRVRTHLSAISSDNVYPW